MSDAASRRLPDFFVIGAPKAGTTTLHRHLQRHPKLFLAEPKEPDFFTSADRVEHALESYAALFSGARADQLAGEMSTTYSRWPHTDDVPHLVASHCPDARYVYVLRHPVERAYSHYAHHMRLGVTMTFEEALERDDVYVDCSRYDLQLERWERVVGSQRILLVPFRELVERPRDAVRRVTDHLGIAPPPAVDAETRANVRGDHHLRRRIDDVLGRVPGARAAAALVPQEVRRRVFRWTGSSRVGRRVRAEVDPPAMLPSTRVRLLEQFAPVVDDIEGRTGWSLDDWRR